MDVRVERRSLMCLVGMNSGCIFEASESLQEYMRIELRRTRRIFTHRCTTLKIGLVISAHTQAITLKTWPEFNGKFANLTNGEDAKVRIGFDPAQLFVDDLRVRAPV